MNDLVLSSHAERRMKQRGFSLNDVELIRDHGIQVDGGFLMTHKAVHAATQRLKRQILRLERLSGKWIVCDGENLITAYHPRISKVRRILRDIIERDMEGIQ